MPKRKAKNEDPEDLQSFLNDIHKETEGSSDDKVVDTILKAISAEDGDLDEHDDEEAAGSNQEEHQAEEEVAAEEEEEEEEDDDDDKYFIDDEGNCYIKTTPRKQKELQKKLKQAAVKPGRPVRSVVSKATNKSINLRPAKSPPKAATSKAPPAPKENTIRPAQVAATKSKQIELPPPPAPAPKVPATRGRPRKNPITPKPEPLDLEREIEELVDEPDINAVVNDLADYAVDSADIEAASSALEATENEVYEFEETAEVEAANSKKDYVFNALEVLPNPKPSSNDSGPKYLCPHCPYAANKKFLVTRHLRSHEAEQAYKCSICERSFRSNVGLQNHVNTHLGKKPHKCKSCDSAFTTSGELIRHTRYKHTKEKPHKCTECSYASVELTKLRRHMTCHTGERPYQCPHCTYASQDMFKLKRHMVIHTGEKKYQCDICQSRFTQSNSLKAHKLIHSVVDKPVYQCNLCPTTCGRKADLRIHVKHMHTAGDLPITCRRCGQQLPDRYQYKLHVKSHDGEKCYRCKLCSYASVTQRHLASHMLIHLDEKPFTCEQCPQTFRQRQLLRRHMNLMHNEKYQPPQPRAKQHQCPTCAREFTHKGNLMRHMEMHDDSAKAREKQRRLKMGRNVRLQKDGTVTTVIKDKFIDMADEESGEEDNPESYDLAEIEPENTDDEDTEVIIPNNFIRKTTQPAPVIINKQARLAGSDNKPTIINRRLRSKTFRIKEEPENSDFTVELQGDDGGVMVVELVNGEGEVVVKREPSGTSNINASNCFGFEEDDEYEDYGNQENGVDGASQEFLQLMDMIEQDS
nr:transcriptional repressor CTCFL [Drosophila suzukii]